MIGFGQPNPFPFTLGGGESPEETEHMALLDALAPGWDADEDPIHNAECLAYAQILSTIWACNKRLTNQALPMRMLENLTTWEEVLKLRPSARDTDVDRRRRVAAKLRGLGNNTIGDIRDAVEALLGENFDDLVFVAPANVVSYWPVNPGPPGFEWTSNRAVLGVRMNKNALSESAFFDKRAALVDLLDSILPSWMTFRIGVGTSFIVNQGVVGQTFL